MENNSSDDPASRKRWAVGSCNTVLGVLGNADIISTGSMETAERPDLISGTTTQIHTTVLQCFYCSYTMVKPCAMFILWRMNMVVI